MKLCVQAYPANTHVKFLTDRSASYTRALGLEYDPCDKGLGVWSKFFTFLVEDLRLMAESRDEFIVFNEEGSRDTSRARVGDGDIIPTGILYYIEQDTLKTVEIHTLADNKGVVIFIVVGPLDASSRLKRVSEFIEKANRLKSDVVDEILCISVNEPFDMKLWAQTYSENKHVKFLADPSATYMRALGLEGDLPDRRNSIRSKCFTLVVEDLEVVVKTSEEFTISDEEVADMLAPYRKASVCEEPLPLKLISNYGSDSIPPPDLVEGPPGSLEEASKSVYRKIYCFRFPLDFAVTLIGTDGMTIKEIRETSKARVAIEALADEEKMRLILNGRTSEFYAAIRKIKDLVAEHHEGADIFSFSHATANVVATRSYVV